VAEFEEGHRVSAIVFCSGRCERMNRLGASVIVSRIPSLFIRCLRIRKAERTTCRGTRTLVTREER
jgi:hypothetical protein